MLKFFRQIRQSLISENKFSKYLLYAIGEIVLVVLGILIALQINNQNEARKREKIEIEFLEGLVVDLKLDSTNFVQKIKGYDTLIVNNKLYLSKAYETQHTYEDYLAVVGLISWDSEDFLAQMATYNELIYSSNLNIFKDKELKNQIISHYREYDRASKHITEFNEFSTNLLSNIPFGHGTFYSPIKPSAEVLKDPRQWGYINEIYSERFLFNIESASLYASKYNVFKNAYYQTLLDNTSELIANIEEELASRINWKEYTLDQIF